MDEADIDLSVVLNAGWVSHELCVKTNDYILDSVSRYPTRLVGFCAIQPKAGDAAIEELELCAKVGAKGFGELRSDVQGFDFSDKSTMKPIVDATLKHDLIFLTHSSEPVRQVSKYQERGMPFGLGDRFAITVLVWYPYIITAIGIGQRPIMASARSTPTLSSFLQIVP